MRRTLAVIAFAAALASPAAAPSFDCAKAQTQVEQAICGSEDLQWLDRQMAQFYAAAHAKVEGAARENLVRAQRDFLNRREACFPSAPLCLTEAYIARLYELGALTGTYEAFAQYVPPKGFDGDLWIARYDFTASIYLMTVRQANAHLCSLEADGASKGGKGVIRLPNRDSRGKSCHVNFVPQGDDVLIETNGCGASFCGHNAWIDGLYTKKR